MSIMKIMTQGSTQPRDNLCLRRYISQLVTTVQVQKVKCHSMHYVVFITSPYEVCTWSEVPIRNTYSIHRGLHSRLNLMTITVWQRADEEKHT